MKQILPFVAVLALAGAACSTSTPTVPAVPAIQGETGDGVSASSVVCTITAVVTPFQGNVHYVQVTGNHDAKGALVNIYGKTTQSTTWTLYGSYSPFVFVEYWNPGTHVAVYAEVQIRRKSDGVTVCNASRYIGVGQ